MEHRSLCVNNDFDWKGIKYMNCMRCDVLVGIRAGSDAKCPMARATWSEEMMVVASVSWCGALQAASAPMRRNAASGSEGGRAPWSLRRSSLVQKNARR